MNGMQNLLFYESFNFLDLILWAFAWSGVLLVQEEHLQVK
jgi:hypothetical protein